MNFDRQGRRITSHSQLLLMSKYSPGRPQKLEMAELDKIALSKSANGFPLFQQKRGRGRPRKNPIEQQTQSKPEGGLIKKRGRGRPRKNPIEQQTQSKPAGDFLIQKRGPGRPRKNPIETENQINLKENYISDVKQKLKLLETITYGYREIERIDKGTQKNVEKLCAMMHNSK